MILRRAAVGLLVGAMLMAPSVASPPALVFEPYNGTVLYAEDPDAQWFPASLTKLIATLGSAFGSESRRGQRSLIAPDIRQLSAPRDRNCRKLQ